MDPGILERISRISLTPEEEIDIFTQHSSRDKTLEECSLSLVQDWGVPFELFNEEAARDIGSGIGTVIDVDDKQFSLEQARFLRIRVEIPLNQPLRQDGPVVDTHIYSLNHIKCQSYVYISGGMVIDQSVRRPRRTEEEGNMDLTLASPLKGLHAMGVHRYRYTWRNGRFGPEFVEERLDRVCANLRWRDLFPTAKVRHQIASYFDHDPIILEMELAQTRN
nr:hypothetical protein CFP56_04694 [Quercus suber]